MCSRGQEAANPFNSDSTPRELPSMRAAEDYLYDPPLGENCVLDSHRAVSEVHISETDNLQVEQEHNIYIPIYEGTRTETVPALSIQTQASYRNAVLWSGKEQTEGMNSSAIIAVNDQCDANRLVPELAEAIPLSLVTADISMKFESCDFPLTEYKNETTVLDPSGSTTRGPHPADKYFSATIGLNRWGAVTMPVHQLTVQHALPNPMATEDAPGMFERDMLPPAEDEIGIKVLESGGHRGPVGRQCLTKEDDKGGPPSSKKLKPPSQRCHNCNNNSSMRTPLIPCVNNLVGKCRKTLCKRCIIVFCPYVKEWSPEELSKWICTHCRGECLPSFRCFKDAINNARRRQRNIQRRAERAAQANIVATPSNVEHGKSSGIGCPAAVSSDRSEASKRVQKGTKRKALEHNGEARSARTPDQKKKLPAKHRRTAGLATSADWNSSGAGEGASSSRSVRSTTAIQGNAKHIDGEARLASATLSQRKAISARKRAPPLDKNPAPKRHRSSVLTHSVSNPAGVGDGGASNSRPGPNDKGSQNSTGYFDGTTAVFGTIASYREQISAGKRPLAAKMVERQAGVDNSAISSLAGPSSIGMLGSTRKITGEAADLSTRVSYGKMSSAEQRPPKQKIKKSAKLRRTAVPQISPAVDVALVFDGSSTSAAGRITRMHRGTGRTDGEAAVFGTSLSHCETASVGKNPVARRNSTPAGSVDENPAAIPVGASCSPVGPSGIDTLNRTGLDEHETPVIDPVLCQLETILAGKRSAAPEMVDRQLVIAERETKRQRTSEQQDRMSPAEIVDMICNW